jgi:5'-methylthioadenosine phosphorylase
MREDLCIGIIGGSGLDEAFRRKFEVQDATEHHPDTPFGRPSSPILTGTIDGTRIAMLQRHGDGHVLNPSAVPYRANIFALKALGCTHVLASGATGSLREAIVPGDIVICDQLIDRTDGRPRTFYENTAVHVEFAEPFCPVMRQWLRNAASIAVNLTVHDGGTYLCMEGPSFSTRAESHMHRAWGADVVGMTACPEARLAREAELAYALIALPTDYDCWRDRTDDQTAPSLLTEIIGNLRRATGASIDLLSVALNSTEYLRAHRSPAREALALGIWTDWSKIPAEERTRLAPLWGHRFAGQ